MTVADDGSIVRVSVGRSANTSCIAPPRFTLPAKALAYLPAGVRSDAYGPDLTLFPSLDGTTVSIPAGVLRRGQSNLQAPPAPTPALWPGLAGWLAEYYTYTADTAAGGPMPPSGMVERRWETALAFPSWALDWKAHSMPAEIAPSDPFFGIGPKHTFTHFFFCFLHFFDLSLV
jgi:hypothetical protein